MRIRGTGAAALMAAALAVGACGTEDCPFGSSSRSGDASVACAARPAATAGETKAATDGSGLRAGLRTFAATGGAGQGLVSIGVNAWGETSFRRSEEDEDAVTFGPGGEERPATGAFRREYALASGSDRVKASDIEPAVLVRGLRGVLRASPGWRFKHATYGSLGIAPGVGWSIDVVRPGHGARVVIVGGGSPCAPAKAPGLGGAPPCDLQELLLGQGQGSSPRASAAPPPGGSELAECVEAAGTDAVALARCAGS